MSHADLSFFETLPDSALIREKLIIGKANSSGDNRQAQSPRLVPVSRSTWRRMVKPEQVVLCPDVDVALETTQMAKLQILNQAATAMLAQASASKQNIP